MPIYTYVTIPDKPDEEPQRLEFQQKMVDPPFTKHPETGVAIRRVITGGSGIIFNGPSIMSMNTKKR